MMITPSGEYLALAATLLDELSDQSSSTSAVGLDDAELMNRYRDSTTPAPSSIRADADVRSTAGRQEGR